MIDWRVIHSRRSCCGGKLFLIWIVCIKSFWALIKIFHVPLCIWIWWNTQWLLWSVNLKRNTLSRHTWRFIWKFTFEIFGVLTRNGYRFLKRSNFFEIFSRYWHILLPFFRGPIKVKSAWLILIRRLSHIMFMRPAFLLLSEKCISSLLWWNLATRTWILTHVTPCLVAILEGRFWNVQFWSTNSKVP